MAYSSVSNTASWRGPLFNTKPVGSATERLCRRRREQDCGKAGEIPSLSFHFFPVLFLLLQEVYVVKDLRFLVALKIFVVGRRGRLRVNYIYAGWFLVLWF